MKIHNTARRGTAVLFFALAMGAANSLHASAIIKTTITANDDAVATLQGTITSKGQSLSGALVSIPDLKRAAITDASGHYTISDIPSGIYLVNVTLDGYASFNERVNLTKNQTFNADLKSSFVEVDEVVLTGVSKATSVKKSPVPMDVVGKGFINEHAAAGNVIDVIANLPGVSAVTTGPNISKPFIHGLGYNRVVTLVDGIRQEGQQWGDEHGIEVDQNAIDRVEVIKGPASLSFGSDAIGGVVNLQTSPSAPEGKILGSVMGLYGTNNGLINTSLNLRGNHKGFVWGTVLTYKGAKDYTNPHDGPVYGTNFKETDARLMLGLNKSWGYSYFNASVFRDQQAIPDGSRNPITRAFTYQATEGDDNLPDVTSEMLHTYKIPVLHQDVQLYRLYNNSNFHIGNGDLLLNLGYQYSYRREYTHPDAPATPGLSLELGTYTYDAKYNFVFGNDFETTVGINGMYQVNKLGKNSTDFPIPEYSQFDFGPFFVIKKSFGKLDLSTGMRSDTRSFSGKPLFIDNSEALPSVYTGSLPTDNPAVAQQFSSLRKTFSGPSGSFGGTYNFSQSILLKANISTGFRAPSIAELSANGADPGSKIYHVGDDSFRPEYSIQTDAGAFFTFKNFSASVELFNNQIKNYIFQQQMLDASGQPLLVDEDGTPNPGGAYSKFTYTQTKARIWGGELNADIHPWPWLHFRNSLSLTYGTNLDYAGNEDLKYLPFISPLHSHSELRATFSKGFDRFKINYAFLSFDHFDPQKKFFAAYGTETYTGGYNLLGAGFGGSYYNTEGKKVVELYVEGSNLANIAYQSNMSRLKYFDNPIVPAGVQQGIFNMGRNISVKLIIPININEKK